MADNLHNTMHSNGMYPIVRHLKSRVENSTDGSRYFSIYSYTTLGIFVSIALA